MAAPHSRIAGPASACEYRSSLWTGILRSPWTDASTIVSIVNRVVRPNTDTTTTTLGILCLAAGYITRGINGSQGPNTNIVNRTQGVRLCPGAAWTWK